MKAKKSSHGTIIFWTVCILLIAAVSVEPIKKALLIKSVNDEKNRIIDTAKANAVQYVKDKYGIEAQAVGDFPKEYFTYYSDEFLIELLPTLTRIPIDMTYGEKEFMVYTDCSDNIPDGCDTYQTDEIATYLSEKIGSALGSGQIINYSFQNYNTGYLDYIVPGTTFPGFYIDKDKFFCNGNFDELADKYYGKITYVCCDTVPDDTEIFTELRNTNIKANIISFDTEEHMNNFIQGKYSLIFDSSIESYFRYLPYITDFRKIDEEHDEHVDFILNDIDDMKYFASNTGCSIEISAVDAVRSAFENDDDPENALSPISSEYKITAEDGSDSVYIYVPLEKFGECAPENAAAAWCTNTAHRFLRPIAVNDRYAIFYFIGLKQTDTVYFILTEHNWEKTDEQTGKRKLFPW